MEENVERLSNSLGCKRNGRYKTLSPFSGPYVGKLYTNDGMGVFTEVMGTSFEGVTIGSVSFADIDGDNDQDVLISGKDNSPAPIAKLYTNDSGGNFSEDTSATFGGVHGSATAFADVDGDNDQDVLISGNRLAGSDITKLYTNDGVGNFTEVPDLPFADVSFGSIVFSDMDGDTDLDVILTGAKKSGTRITQLYSNETIVSIEESLINETDVLLYPNPSALGEVYLSYPSGKHKSLKLSLIDLNGKILSQFNTPVIPGSNLISFAYRDVPKGWYLIRLDDGSQIQFLKFLVQ